MGRLIDPGLGELVDRYSILTLKQLRSATPDHFCEEAENILRRLPLLFPAVSPFDAVKGMAMVERAIELAAVNGIIWEATEEMRASIYCEDVTRVVDAAKTLYNRNRRRSELIHTLNELEADKPLPEEKV